MSIYNSIYDLINNYVFGGNIIAESVQDLATTLISLAACGFLIALPFVLVIKMLNLVVR